MAIILQGGAVKHPNTPMHRYPDTCTYIYMYIYICDIVMAYPKIIFE